MSAISWTPDGDLYTINNSPDELREILGTNEDPVIHTSSFFGLASIASDADGILWFGDRSSGNAGLWRADPSTGEVDGPFDTGLPPFTVVYFP